MGMVLRDMNHFDNIDTDTYLGFTLLESMFESVSLRYATMMRDFQELLAAPECLFSAQGVTLDDFTTLRLRGTALACNIIRCYESIRELGDVFRHDIYHVRIASDCFKKTSAQLRQLPFDPPSKQTARFMQRLRVCLFDMEGHLRKLTTEHARVTAILGKFSELLYSVKL